MGPLLTSASTNDREKVRRAYLLRGPYQPIGHKFPSKVIGRKKRKFIVKWFTLYKPWLEYSVKGDATYCLYCYLCADDVVASDDTSFAKGGFRNWKKPEKFRIHVGGVNSSHNQCRRKCEDLMNQDQHIEHSFVKQSISFRAHDDILREKQVEKIVEAMSLGEIKNGRGLHQEYTLQRENDTRWSSHCKALINIGLLFPSIIFVLGHVMRDGVSADQKGEAKGLLAWLTCFDFAFTSIMMKNILRITNTLALALQKKEVFESVYNDLIMQRFQNMTKRRYQLPNKSK
ncbi:zinc finger MYM-type protein 1-like protein [Tanacetum coccineum]